MRKKIIAVFVLSLSIPFLSHAKNKDVMTEKQALDRFYESFYVGEKKTQNYFGPIDPRAIYNGNSGDQVFLDDDFSRHYLNDQIEGETFNLHTFWVDKIIDKSTCPDVTLGENIDYIRYLYRLLTLSYLYESLKINNRTMTELGSKNNSCKISFSDVFGKCSPKTFDMKKFHERVEAKFSNDIFKVKAQRFNAKEMSSWMKDFKKSTSLTSDPIYARLHDNCRKNDLNCRSLSLDEMKKTIDSICNEDQELIVKICSEEDQLYGASFSEKATSLIQSSNAFNLINKSGMGEDCLRRYVKIFSSNEIHYSPLNRLYSLIFSHLIRTKERYAQGEIFLPGALKEFDNKGLSDFLTALKPLKIEPVIKIIPTPKPVAVVIPKPVEKVIVAAPLPEPVKVVEAPKVILSEFETILKELDTKNLASLSVDMNKFRNDFEFTAQMLADLAVPIKNFQTRAALNDMKSYDNLGSFEAPVGLIFLKYLLVTQNHQGLFNITTVLGDKFYVVNDIENKERSVFIELRNNASTNNQWQILINRDPRKK